MAATGSILLAHGEGISAVLKAMAIAILALSPFPV